MERIRIIREALKGCANPHGGQYDFQRILSMAVASLRGDMAFTLAHEVEQIMQCQAEALALLDAEQESKPVAWMREWKYLNQEGTRGNRPQGWHLKAVTAEKLLPSDIPLYTSPNPEQR